MPGRNTRIAILLASAAVCGHAQWVNYRSPGTPRTRDGKADLSAPAPRAANGKPDLSGVWQVEPTPLNELTRLFGDMSTFSVPGDDASTFSKYLINILADYKTEEQPLRPEAARILGRRNETGELHPTTRCLAAGVPMAQLIPIPFKILQTPGLTAMLFEGDGTHRQIYTDGRKPPADPEPLWLGYSVGKWESETLVVDTVGFNDKSWLDAMGHAHSDALHVTERFHRRDFGHLDVQVTVEDPKMYTRPFTVKFTHRLVPDSDILESFCAENEKDRAHMAKK